MTPVTSLNPTQKKNIGIIVSRCSAKGVTGKAAQAAILSIVGKECNFIPQSENLNYTASRLLQVFPSRVKTVAQANALAGKPELIANSIYGGRYGNAANEGYKFRGRGFNQITFKDTYAKIGKLIGVDLVGKPDLLNDPAVAADAMIAYFMERVKLYYPKVDINKVTSLYEALKIFYNANAGAVNKHLKDTTGGYVKAKSNVEALFTLVKENKTATGGGLFFLIVAAVAIAKRKQISEFINKHKPKK
jgi:predicted chitinase